MKITAVNVNMHAISFQKCLYLSTCPGTKELTFARSFQIGIQVIVGKLSFT